MSENQGIQRHFEAIRAGKDLMELIGRVSSTALRAIDDELAELKSELVSMPISAPTFAEKHFRASVLAELFSQLDGIRANAEQATVSYEEERPEVDGEEI